MATVVGVVFQPGGKVYSFDPGGLELRWDERVICQTSRGREYGRVVQTPHEMPDEELTGPLKRVVRRAGPADDEQVKREPGRGQAGHAALPRAGRPPRARAEADRGRARVRPGPHRLLVLVRGAPRHPRAPGRPGGAAEAAGRAAPGRAARAGPPVRRGGPVRHGEAVQRPLPLPRPAHHPEDGQGAGSADEPGPHHWLVRAATLLFGVRAPGVPLVPRPGAGRGADGGDTQWEGDRPQLRSAEGRVRRRTGRKDDGGDHAWIRWSRWRDERRRLLGPRRRPGARRVQGRTARPSGCGAATSSSRAPIRAQRACSTS